MEDQWNFAEVAKRDLLQLGFPPEKLISAPCEYSELQRTFESAIEARRTMEAQGLHPKGINILTRGAHARRTRLVYSKVFSPRIEIGIISWHPYVDGGPWWRSSMRAKEVLDESFGFAYEWLLSSGRLDKTLKTRLIIISALFLTVVVIVRHRRLVHAKPSGHPSVG